MLSSVIPFRKKVDAVSWRPDELAECYRVVGLLARSGLPVSIDSGLTDEGEPWAIVLREDTGDVLLHMARLDGSFVVVSAAGSVAQRGKSLRAVLDTAVRTGSLAMLTRSSAAADSEILRLHPATLIAAFITAAWVNTETSQSDLLQASARREGGSISRTDEARSTGVAIQSPSAALVTAAASFAAVATALDAAQVDSALEVIPEDFVQAALGLLATTSSEALITALPINFEHVEFANLQLQQGTPVSSSTMMGEPASQEALPFETVAASASTPIHAAGAVDILHFSIQDQNSVSISGPAWAVGILHDLRLDFRGTVQFLPTEEVEPLAASALLATEDEVPTDCLTTDILTPVRANRVVTPQLVRDEEDGAIARAKISIFAVEEAGLRLAHSVDALTLIFKSAAQILHLDSSVALAAPDVAISAEKDDGHALTPTMGSDALLPASKGTNGELLSKSTSVVSSASDAPVVQATSRPQDAPSASDVSGGGGSLTGKVQPPPPPPPPRSNAQLLLEFTTGTEHVMHVDRSGFTGALQANLDIGDVRKVVVFDAPWLAIKSFMLMPGVMMVEDDLLGGVSRADMEVKGSPSSLNLGDGLSLTLLGVVDFSLT